MKKLVIAAVLLLLGGAWYSAVGNYVKKPQEYEQLIKSAERPAMQTDIHEYGAFFICRHVL